MCPSEALQKETSDRKEQWLQELDEEEYDALPEEDKEQIVRQHTENHRQQKVRYWKTAQHRGRCSHDVFK